MSCTTCGHTMRNLGVPDARIFWCPRCGTISDQHAAWNGVSMPTLVQHCRDFETTLVGSCAEHLYQWNAYGIRDSIQIPEERPAL